MPASPAAPGSTALGEPRSDAGRRRAGRPVGGVLDKAGITAAALKLIEKKGYDGLTMAALALSLNVAPSAL